MLTSTWSAEYRWEQGHGQLWQKGGTGPHPVPSREEIYSGAMGYNMDTPALGSAGLLHTQLACCCLSNLGFGVSSQGWAHLSPLGLAAFAPSLCSCKC